MSKLSRNIIYNLLGQGSLLIISFLAVKYIFHQLGAEVLGIIYFIMALNTILAVALEMGVSSTLVREISSHFDSDKEYIKKLIHTFSFFYWSIYLVAALIIFFVAPFFVQKWIHLSSISPDLAINIIRILGVTSVTTLLVSFYSSLIRGLQKMKFNNLIDVVSGILQHGGALLILIFNGSLMLVIYWFAVSYILKVCIYFLVSGYLFSFPALTPKFSSAVIKRNFKFILNTTFISIFSTIHIQADKISISKFLPISTLGYYSLAYTSVSQATLLTDSVSMAAYPSFSSLAKEKDKNELMSQYYKLQDLLCFGILPIFAAIPFALVPVFSFLFNAQIANLLLLPTTFLCLGIYMNGTVTIPYVFSLAVGKPNITAKMNFYALFFVLPPSVILIYFFGLPAAGLYLVFYHIFAYFYSIPKICKECLGIKVKDWYFHIFRIFILAILTYGASWFILGVINNHSIFALILAYLLSSVVYLYFSYFLITKELKKTLFYYVQLLLNIKKSK